MEEIYSAGGESFKIWYESLDQRENAIKEALSMNREVKSLATTCPAAGVYKTVGQTITMTSNTTGANYSYTFYKMLPGSVTPITIGTANQASNTVTYTTTIQDVVNASGQQLKVGVIIYDNSCLPTPTQGEESCYVPVYAACTIPVANLTVT